MPGLVHRALARAVDRVLDPTVALSFDRSGYLRHAVNFIEGDLDVDLTGKVVLITGANSGLGRETAWQLAARGAQVWLLCRSARRGQAALRDLRAELGEDIHLALVDLGDQDSIDACLPQLPPRVDVLIHNAGALLVERRLTPQCLETMLAVQLVGPFRLTMALLPRMERGLDQAPARIIWVSSGAIYTRKLSVDRLGETRGAFDGPGAYADVKRAQVVLSEALAQDLAERGVVSNAMHPGWVETRDGHQAPPALNRLGRRGLSHRGLPRRVLRDTQQGADTIVWLAACPRIARETGKLWFDRQEVSPHLLPATREDLVERQRLWRAVMDWSGVGAEAG